MGTVLKYTSVPHNLKRIIIYIWIYLSVYWNQTEWLQFVTIIADNLCRSLPHTDKEFMFKSSGR